MSAKTIMIQGTGSDVGKSVIVTALCRIFAQEGYKTAPFKSQNMSLNSFPTLDGKEIGMAQAVQAEAAMIGPAVDMNPILLKPTAKMGAQVIIRGKPIGLMSAKEYINKKYKFFSIVKESLANLIDKFDIVVIEGAGSPAEINLKEHDIVNMKIAELADAPVVLVGDIDRGGVFASIVGTLELLERHERDMVKGIIINKFRGDMDILKKGLSMLEDRTGVRVLGVLPYYDNISIYSEDSMSLDLKRCNRDAQVKVSVIRLPMISNFTDFEPFTREVDVELNYITNKDELTGSDVIIIPGTKNTIEDLLFLKSEGYFPILEKCRNRNTMIIGICGGYQMLGRVIADELGIESKYRRVEGLGFLNIETCFKSLKTTEQVEAISTIYGNRVKGYEIHMGETKINDDSYEPAFKVVSRGGKPVEMFDGIVSKDRSVWGTYIHGVFEDNSFRKNFLNAIREKKGLAKGMERKLNKNIEYDRLAELFKENIRMDGLIPDIAIS